MKNLQISTEEDCGVPAPKDCASPVLKRSPVLQQLTGQMGTAAEKTENTQSHTNSSPPYKEATGEKHREGAKENVSKEGAVQIQEKARESQKEVKILERKADHYDSAELFLEVSIVLCSISLLTGAKLYWRLSFISTTLGIAVALWGYLQH